MLAPDRDLIAAGAGHDSELRDLALQVVLVNESRPPHLTTQLPGIVGDDRALGLQPQETLERDVGIHAYP